MYKIQKISSYFVAIFNFLFVGRILMLLASWVISISNYSAIKGFIQNFETPLQTPEGAIKLSTVHWTPFTLFIRSIGEILGTLSFLLSLYFLKLIFQNYKKGEIFSTLNSNYYRYLGWFFFLDAFFLKPVSETLLVLAATLSNPPGHRHIILTFGTPNLEILFCGAIIIVIAWVMGEASKLQEEQKFII